MSMENDELVKMLKKAKKKLEEVHVPQEDRILRMVTNWGIAEIDSDGNVTGDDRAIAELRSKGIMFEGV